MVYELIVGSVWVLGLAFLYICVVLFLYY